MPGFLPHHPRLAEVLVSLGLLLASYVAARIVAYLLGLLVARSAPDAPTGLDDRLLAALERPVTYSLFLVGAYAALHRLPVGTAWLQLIHSLFFVSAVLLVTLAFARSYAILLEWYARPGRTLNASQLASEFRPLFSKLGKLFLAMIALIVVLQHFGVNVQSLVVSLGVGSLAVGLAAQDTLSNMFAGFTIMMDRPFRVGDRIQLATGEVGDVQSIGMRATLLKTTDETILIVPNSVLVKERLVNLSLPTHHVTTRVSMSVAYGTDLTKVRAILKGAARGCALVDQEREPEVQVTRIVDFSVNCLLVFWVKHYADQGRASGLVYEEVHRLFAEAGIAPPLPTTRVIHEGETNPDAEGE